MDTVRHDFPCKDGESEPTVASDLCTLGHSYRDMQGLLWSMDTVRHDFPVRMECQNQPIYVEVVGFSELASGWARLYCTA